MGRLRARKLTYPGGYYVWVWTDQEQPVRVPDSMRKCVGFIGCRRDGQLFRGGTAFFVRSDSSEFGWGATVTARHNINQVRALSDDGKVLLWVNSKDGGTIRIESSVDDWMEHTTDTQVDVAAFPHLPPNTCDYAAVLLEMAATDEVIAREHIGIGDDLWVTGLFTSHSGRNRNVPILRLGSIAAMPEEPVLTKDLGYIEGYLAEVRSIGGLSGSPVFAHLSILRDDLDAPEILPVAEKPWYLLGLVHGHYNMKAVGDPPEPVAGTGLTADTINTGIAIVVPVTKILEVLNQPKLEEMRQQQREDGQQEETAATADSEFGEFAALTEKLFQVPKEEADEIHRGHQP